MPKRARDLARIGAAGGVLRAGPVEVTAKARRTTDLQLASTVGSQVDFDVEEFDSAGMFDLGDPAVIQIRHRGRFTITYRAYSATASADTYLRIEKLDTANTQTTLRQHGFDTGSAGVIDNQFDYFLTAGERLRMWFQNDSGGNRTITAVANSDPFLMVHLSVRGG